MVKKIATILWCILLIIFAIYSLLYSRANISLSRQMGLGRWKPLVSQPQKNFKFAVFGDSHSCRISLNEILQKSQKNCDFAVHLGDFVEFDDEFEYRYFCERIQPFIKNFSLFLVRGNHETMAPGGGFTNHFLSYVPNPNYSFVHKECLFYVLDNSMGKFVENEWEICQTELANFRKESLEKPIFLFMHIAPKDLFKSDRDALERMVINYNVSFLFAGDTHSYSEESFGTAQLIVSGCGGGSVHNPSSEVHFVEVSVVENKVTTKKVAVTRDSMFVVVAAYLLFVAVPRYRWYFFTGTMFLLLWEYVVYRRGKSVSIGIR